jgi:hypothetical protein
MPTKVPIIFNQRLSIAISPVVLCFNLRLNNTISKHFSVVPLHPALKFNRILWKSCGNHSLEFPELTLKLQLTLSTFSCTPFRSLAVKKLIKKRSKDVDLLKQRLDGYNDNWRT